MISVSFLGLRTQAFAEMRSLYLDGFALPVIHDTPGAVWFGLADQAELHLYAESDSYHEYFGTGPVPGHYVDDFAASVERLDSHGVQWLTEPDTAAGRTWRHYRAPDGNVYEVMGPLSRF